MKYPQIWVIYASRRDWWENKNYSLKALAFSRNGKETSIWWLLMLSSPSSSWLSYVGLVDNNPCPIRQPSGRAQLFLRANTTQWSSIFLFVFYFFPQNLTSESPLLKERKATYLYFSVARYFSLRRRLG